MYYVHKFLSFWKRNLDVIVIKVFSSSLDAEICLVTMAAPFDLHKDSLGQMRPSELSLKQSFGNYIGRRQ